MLTTKVEYTLDDDNRVSTRLMYAKVNSLTLTATSYSLNLKPLKVLIWVGGITLTMTSVLTQKCGFQNRL